MKVVVIGENQVMKDISFYLQLRWQNAIVISAAEGSNGIDLVEAEAPDLVIADFCLADMSGLDLVGKVREFSDVPLVILVDQETGMERSRVLETGADYCVTKSFSPVDLLAKVNALLRRAYAAGFRRDHMPLVSGNLTISLSTHEAFLSGEPVKLTPHEYDLLLELVRNEGRVLTHHALLEKIWGTEYAEDSDIVRKCICRLRHKLADDAHHPRMILSERGIGYKLVKQA
jgi:two-component system KDP operon response regulator KdpE